MIDHKMRSESYDALLYMIRQALMNSLGIQQQNKDDIEMSLSFIGAFVIDFAAFIGKCKYQI